MNRERKISLADDWQRNWQESIAVRISALVLWITIPVIVIAAIVYLDDAEEALKKEYTDRADLLAFRIENTLLYTTSLQNPRLKETLRTIASDAGFAALKIEVGDERVVVGEITPELESMIRGIPIVLPTQPGVANTIEVIGYHIPLKTIVAKKRENTLVVIVLALTAFGLFLMWAIRMIVHRPLRTLVDATQQVSAGNTELRLAPSGDDEFASLSRFFNKMLDALMVQQKKVEHALSEAEQANRAKSVFLANMSHELRTPLNAIIGYSDMLAEEAQELGNDTALSDLRKIKTAGRHLLDLINNILDISKIEAGKMELFVETIDVRAMVNDIVVTVQPLIERNKNVLNVECPEKIGSIRGDVTKLRQTLLNLLGNGAKFTENGFISLRVERFMYDDTECIRFIVSDTGIGMSEEQLRHAFHAFAQGDGSIARRYGGTGLGLAISRHYVSLMGGEMTVRSAPGKGTTFTVRIPAEAHAASERRIVDERERSVA